MEVLDDLLEGDHDDQLYHQLFCFDFDDDDDEDEDYIESPKKDLSAQGDAAGGAGSSSSHQNNNENTEENQEEEDDEDDVDVDVDGIEDDEDDDHTEASSIADDEDDFRLGGEDNKRRYRINRQLKQEAADLIDDWQKTLLEEQATPFQATTLALPMTSPFLFPTNENFQVCITLHFD